MIIKSYGKFKKIFNDLFKKYHPDNKETGDAEKFIKYKNTYDKLLNSDVLKNIQNNIELDITTTQAFNGCEIKYMNYTIKIPKYFYNDKKFISVTNKNGDVIKFFINIVPEKDESIYYNSDSDLIVIKNVHVNIFDVILGNTKTLNIFGEEYNLKIKPYSIFHRSSIIIPNKGYKKRHSNIRNDLTIKFIFDNIELSKKDIKIIKGLSKKYE